MNFAEVHVWDGVSDAMEQRSLVVEDGVFTASKPGASTELKGMFAIPGLIDAHVHMCLNPDVRDPDMQTVPGNEQLLAEMRQRAGEMVRAGITTARDLGGGEYLELQLRDEIAAGQIPGPRLLCAGQPVTSVNGHCHFWGGEAADLSAALKVVERQAEHGVDLIKIMVTGGNITPGSRPVDSQFDEQTVVELVKAASAHNYHVAAHCHGTDGIRQAATAGVNTVEHCSWVGDAGWGKSLDMEVVELLASNDVWVSPTINFGWNRFKQPEFVDMITGNYEKMKAAGIRLIASTDAGIPNVRHEDLPRALPVFARFAGLSPVEVLRSATSDCARAIGLGSMTGQIAQGYAADFVVYERNPLEDLCVLETPVMVVSRGTQVPLD